LTLTAGQVASLHAFAQSPRLVTVVNASKHLQLTDPKSWMWQAVVVHSYSHEVAHEARRYFYATEPTCYTYQSLAHASSSLLLITSRYVARVHCCIMHAMGAGSTTSPLFRAHVCDPLCSEHASAIPAVRPARSFLTTPRP